MERRTGVDTGVDSGVQLLVDSSDGGLKEIVLKWFTETQAPLIVRNGNFPDWFQGFTTRKDAEDLLRDKALGCFLIRLSDKAIGFILSYRGHDRCRHFVITQDQDGQFLVSGDCQTHGSLSELIEHYRVHPIQPFGELLTCICSQVNTAELYDVVNFESKRRSGVSVQALRTLWDQKNDRNSGAISNHKTDKKTDPPASLPPSLPPKSKSRKLTGAVSVDTVSLSQGVPPVPKRGLPLGFSLSGSLPDTSPHPGETQSNLNSPERLRGSTNLDSFQSANSTYPGDLCPPGSAYPEPARVESRSRSLPRLNLKKEEDDGDDDEEEYSNQHSASLSSSSLSALKKVTCHTYSLHTPRVQQGDEEEMSRRNPLYQDSERPARNPSQLEDDNTYELIPEEAAAAAQGNTYETLEDMKSKKSKSTWGKSNVNWKKFLPDYKKK